MYNASGALFGLSPFILKVGKRTDTRGAGSEKQMSGLTRPGVTSHNRFFFIVRILEL
jgi:hypothetical protein